ncbi:hypothetical protein LZ198_35140 [Myxococcus sp. K15C18031901]|uniref:LVIVD repeat-containing protein n=1 Tax=Myxococcus dinghuensis TaxID=2906761 RepID=UPI0020A7F187|nr:hypothetical protein [Myxococcus dinghuensis]MCP3104119.1 hypothetical protein [Myxococcus dinghuensis]
MRPTRLASMVLLACAASISGCSGAVEDAPWDGNYTPLVERGDWVDSGPKSTCRVLGEEAPCGSLESFDLSKCQRRTLSTLERQGIYRGELRPSFGAVDATLSGPVGAGFKLDAQGVPERVQGLPAAQGVWDARTFLISGQDGREVFTFAGCNAVSPRALTGCYSRCVQGHRVESGTFRVERMSRFKGEADLSGGLRLVSETFVGLGAPVDVHVVGHYAYVVSQNQQERPGGLTVFDVSDPAAPVQVARLVPPGNTDWKGAASRKDALYIASSQWGVVVVDISVPTAPKVVGHVPEEPTDVSLVSVAEERLYALSTSPRSGTLMFDLATPSVPLLMERITSGSRMSDEPYSRGAVSYEGRLYVNHLHDGLQIVDARNATRVEVLGRYTYPYTNSRASAVGTFAGRVVAFESSLGVGARLRALDVTDPAHIAKIGEYGLRGAVSPRGLELRGNRLYMTYHQEGLRVLDVSNPTRPREVAYFNSFRETDPDRGDTMTEGATGLQVPGDGHVYVVDTSRGLLVLTEPQ